jgi:glycine/serine hydroxymethyltransferase
VVRVAELRGVLQVRKNAVALAERLIGHGNKLITDGTDNHLVLWDLRPWGISGAKVEKVCDLVHITLNKNAVVGDTTPMNPGGVRIGESLHGALTNSAQWPCEAACALLGTHGQVSLARGNGS